ncbi:hypothetical protein CASFOL_027896 [Castilleja foliolosa]|uniref:Uncharacterized protein n=1 Tax=Castilleja foliolosa TaxID=1961234 RepID=A0ABD3CG45_9LAMI
MEGDNFSSSAPAVSDAASYVLPSVSALSIRDVKPKPSITVNPPAVVNPTFLPPPPFAFQPCNTVIMHIDGTVPVQILLYFLSDCGVIQNFEYHYYGSFQSIGTCKVTYATVESKTALLNSPHTITPGVMKKHASGEACPFNCGF